MTVKDLKKIIKEMPDDRQVFVVGYNGTTIKRHTHPCCNTEYQTKINELWISSEGLLVT